MKLNIKKLITVLHTKYLSLKNSLLTVKNLSVERYLINKIQDIHLRIKSLINELKLLSV